MPLNTQSNPVRIVDTIDGTVAGITATNTASSNGLHVLPARATTSAPSLTEGAAAFLSFDLTGRLRILTSGIAVGVTDDSVFTGGASSVNPIGALYDATPPTITDGNVGVPRMSSQRVLFAELRDQSGDSAMDDATNAARVLNVANVTDGTVTEPTVGVIGGWDGIAVRSLKVQSIDGHNTLFVHDTLNRRLLEDLLIEQRVMNQLLMRLVGPVAQSDLRGDLRIVA